MNFQEIRQKYPQYSDMNDEEFASKFHQKFYSDMPFDQFSSKVGYSAKQSDQDTRSEALKALDKIQPPAKLTPSAPEPSWTDKAYAAGEAAMETIARPFVSVPANLYGLYKQATEGANPEKASEELSQKILSSPKTQVGQDYTEAIGRALDPLVGSGILQSPSMMHQLSRSAIRPPRDIAVTPGSIVAGEGKPVGKPVEAVKPVQPEFRTQMDLDLGFKDYAAEIQAQREAQAKAELEGIYRDASKQEPQRDMFYPEDNPPSGLDPHRFTQEQEPVPYDPTSVPDPSLVENNPNQMGFDFSRQQKLSEPVELAQLEKGTRTGIRDIEANRGRIEALAEDFRQGKVELGPEQQMALQQAMTDLETSKRRAQANMEGALDVGREAAQLGIEQRPGEPINKNLYQIFGKKEQDSSSPLGQTSFGKSQRGSWTPFARRDKVSDIPGIKEKLKYMMDPEFLEYDKARENLIGTPDIKEGQIRNNIMSGGQMMSQFFKNDLVTWSIGMIKSFAEQARIAIRDSEYEAKQRVNEVRKVAGEDTLIRVMNALARGENLTSENLGAKGRELVETLQKINDKTYDTVNTEYKILSKGKELPKKENYFNHSWNGPWGFEVRALNEKGNYVVIEVVREKTKRQAQAALDHANSLGLDLQLSDLTYNSKFDKLYGKEDTGFFQESIDSLLNLSTEGSSKAKEAQQQFRDHFKYQTGVGGYLGNKPWKTPKENMVEALQSFYDYTNAANQWAAAKKAQRELNKFINDKKLDPETGKPTKEDLINAPNAKQLAQQYYNNAFGRNKQSLELVDDAAEFLAKQTGISKGQIYSFVRNNKSFMTLLTLAYKPAFIFTQEMQPFSSVLPKMAEISGRVGQSTSIPLNFILGFADSMGAWRFLPEGDIIRNYVEKNHVIDPRVIQHLEGYDTKGRTWDFTEKGLAAPNNLVEKQTRHWAFSSLYRTARELGLSIEDSLNLAKNQTETSMTSYESADRPLGYGKLGMVGETASNLQTYKHNAYTALIDYFKQAKNDKLYAPFIMAVSMQAFLAGAIGFYAWNELDSIFEGLKKIDNAVTGGKLIGQLPSMTEMVIKKWPSAVSFGGLSALTDYDLSGGFNAGGILPDSPLQAVFPLLTKEIDMVRSGFEAVKNWDNKEDWGVFLQKSLPAVAQGQIAKQLLTRELPNGKKVKIRSAIDPSQRVGEVDNPDSNYYNSLTLGTKPLEVSKTAKLKYEDIRSERNIKDRLNSVEDEILRSISNGDKERVGKLYKQYLDFGGDPEDINPRLEKFIRQRSVADPMGQMLNDSDSTSAALRNKRIIERFKK